MSTRSGAYMELMAKFISKTETQVNVLLLDYDRPYSFLMALEPLKEWVEATPGKVINIRLPQEMLQDLIGPQGSRLGGPNRG